jgi:cell division cycle 14
MRKRNLSAFEPRSRRSRRCKNLVLAASLMAVCTLRPILERLYLCQDVDILPEGDGFRQFVPDSSIQYYPLCDDFGPMNLSSIIKFTRQLDEELEQFSSCILFYSIDLSRRSLTNAIFLLGSYMILRLDMDAGEVAESIQWLDVSLTEGFRDATYSLPDFNLSLIDCWRALSKGIEIGWVELPSSIIQYKWGEIDVEEYDHYDNPLNGDMHEIVPGKFIAFKGPRDLGGEKYVDTEQGWRDFSPEFYAELFEDFGVSDVVRLNEPHYEGRHFADRGISFHELEFEDCTAPPDAVVEAFVRLVDDAPGAVAVHCKAGLGRTGTLIGVYLMRRFGFTAREAMGWLRIMRPGSVIGEQQHYLCAVEDAARKGPAASGDSATEAPVNDGSGGVGVGGGAGAGEACSELAAQVAAGRGAGAGGA